MEEIVFRSCISTLIYYYYTKKSIMTENYTNSCLYIGIISSLFFSLAHLTHFYENIRKGEKIIDSLIIYLVIFTYTFFFSFISFYFYLTTKNIFSCILSHIICNLYGLPEIDSDSYKIVKHILFKNNKIIIILCYFLHILGLILFYFLFIKIMF